MELYTSKAQDYFSAARSEISDLLPSLVAARVLEVGCGAGQTLEMIKQRGGCDETVGIELFPAAAEAARGRVDVVYNLNVEETSLPAELGRFSLILLLDVLEHLVDPWKFLKELRANHLAEGGRFIISLPNAQHFSLVLPLLQGKFEYVERGLRDKTHLRFFTKSSATSMLEEAGLAIEGWKPTSLDLKLNSGKLNALTLGIFAGFLTSQHIFLASSRESAVRHRE